MCRAGCYNIRRAEVMNDHGTGQGDEQKQDLGGRSEVLSWDVSD